MRLEAEEEEDFTKYAHRNGCRVFKLVWTKKGWPDRTVFMPGARVIFMEFKRGNNEQSVHQDKIKKWLTDLGFKWYTPYSFAEAKTILDAYLDTPQIPTDST